MRELVQQLADNLDRTTTLYEGLLESERHKQQAIVEGSIDLLAEILARQEHLVAEADELEAQRLVLRDRLAQADARIGPAPRLSHLIDVVDGPERQRLVRQHQRFLALAQELQDVNRTNFQLLRSSLELLRGVIDEVFGPPSAPATYDASGRARPPGHDANCVNQVL